MRAPALRPARCRLRALCAALALFVPLAASAQDPARDVLPEQLQPRAFVGPTGLVRLGPRVLFSAFHVTTGQEL